MPVERVPIRSQVIRPLSTYWLADLSRFEADAPLASDPAHFVLSLAALQLPGLSAHEQDALVRFVVDIGDDDSAALLPSWVKATISQVMGATPEWIERSFLAEWREQTLLSLVAWGLIFAGRPTTAEAQRGWFLRIAAHAARAYHGDDGPGTRVVARRPSSGPSTDGAPVPEPEGGPTDETGLALGAAVSEALPNPRLACTA